jgi:hypothetical protein
MLDLKGMNLYNMGVELIYNLQEVMGTKINNEQRGAFARIVEKTQFVDKELETKLDDELKVLLSKHDIETKKWEALDIRREQLVKEADEIRDQQKNIEGKLEKFGIDRESGYNQDPKWGLTYWKNSDLTEKLNGKFSNFKEQITKKIWASQEVEVAEALVDEFLKRNKTK